MDHESIRIGHQVLLHRARSLPIQISGNEEPMVSRVIGKSSSREQPRKRGTQKPEGRYRLSGFLLFVRFLEVVKCQLGQLIDIQGVAPIHELLDWRTH